MVNAGANITAFLKLNADGFQKGINESVTAVEKFKTTMMDVGKVGPQLQTGIHTVSRAIQDLLIHLNKFSHITKQLNNFEKFATGLGKIANAAHKVSVDVRGGQVGIESLNAIIKAYSTGVSNAEIKVTGLASAIKQLNMVQSQSRSSASSSTQSINSLNNSYKSVKGELDLLAKSYNIYGTNLHRMTESEAQARAFTQYLRKEYGLSGQALVSARGRLWEFRSALMQTATATQQYSNALTIARNPLQQFSTRINTAKMSLVNLSELLVRLPSSLRGTSSVINSMTGEFSRLKSSMDQLSNSYRVLKISSDGENVTLEKSSQALAKNSAEMMKNAEAQLKKLGYNGRVVQSEGQVANATNRATTSVTRQLYANKSATASTNQLTSATTRLGRAMSSLRMMGSLVGSMLAYNFAHKLLVATGETIHAKSEMEGYFKMLNFSQKEINGFNKALDNTVAQFQRVNKYSLGETISSIGVEFNLSTKEMEKAMKVTSMITSEYLRAGRNANEASLAVKDVLQGQFQRLSRETGVKGEQLKDAGWSGDTTDVLGLMKALETVSHNRNWDVFAEKANSLNDILTITQNRFGEWSADMVYNIQPMIVSSFNAIMSVSGFLANALEGLWGWLNGDGLVNQAVKWTGLATAITTVTTALVSYRTGANLVQIVQMGVRGSIMATVFGLKAEEVAIHGSRNALISKITSLKAEQVAQMGSLRAIATKVLGLNAEMVAHNGIKGAIMSEVLARKLEEAEMIGASATHKAMIVLEHEEQIAKMSSLKVIMAKIAGVNMETFAEKGLIVALAQRVASSLPYISALKAEEVAEMSTARASLFLMGSLLPLVAILGGLAVGLYALIKPLQEASEEMKKFNDLLNNGESIIKSNKKTMDSYEKSVNSLKEKQSQLAEGTFEYKKVSDQLKATQDDLKTATDNYKNSVKAVEMAQSSSTKFQEERTKILIHGQTELKKAYIDAGISSAKASELASDELANAKKGAEQLRKALQMIKFESDKGTDKQKSLIGKLDAYGISDKEIEKYGQNMLLARDKINQGLEAFMTSDDLMERVQGWFTIQQGRLEEWWTEFNALFEIRDWDALREKARERFKYLVTGLGTYDWVTPLKESVDKKGVWNTIVEALFGEGTDDGIVDIIRQSAIDNIWKPLDDWLTWFSKAPIDNLFKMSDSFSLNVAKFLFGKDSSSIKEMVSNWFNNNFRQPVIDWIQGFIDDPLAYLGNGVIGISNWFGKLLFGEDSPDYAQIFAEFDEQFNQLINGFFDYISSKFTSDNTESTGVAKKIDSVAILRNLIDFANTDFSWVTTMIVDPFKNALLSGLANIPIIGGILQLLGVIPQANPNAQSHGNQLANVFGGGVLSVVGNIPILGDVLKFLGVIPQANPTAQTHGDTLGDKIRTGVKTGIQGTADAIRSEMGNVITAVRERANEAYDSAHDVGSQILSGIKNALDMHSPSIISRELIANEFGVYIPQAMTDNGDVAYSSAQYYGQQIRDGISSVNTDGLGLGTAVGEYENDAQIIASSSQMMGVQTTTAFNNMQSAVNNTTSSMSANVGTTYSQMQQKQNTSLQSMKTQNLSAYNEMYLKSNQSLLQMRDSTTNVTNQMVSAWTHMKVQLVATANQLRSESTSHFNNLSETIGSFYRKIQNPSNWGAGHGSVGVRSARNPSMGKSIASSIRTRSAIHHGAGGSTASPYFTNRKTMTLRQLKQMICPTGECGIFDGYDLSQTVNVAEFLSSVGGEHGFGWSGWNKSHYNYIKNTSDEWDMKSPRINLVGGIDTNTNFKVGDFENGSPKISFGSFQSMAESIFSAIPYRFYYDSAWKGSWLGALQAGACNCSDGADALIAFANACGFDGYKQHGQWRDASGKTYGHFWAVINGHKMDTTGWQQRGTWTPSASAGSPMVRRATHTADNTGGKVVNVTVNINEPVYGVDDLNTIIVDATKQAMREEFNDPYTVNIA